MGGFDPCAMDFLAWILAINSFFVGALGLAVTVPLGAAAAVAPAGAGFAELPVAGVEDGAAVGWAFDATGLTGAEDPAVASAGSEVGEAAVFMAGAEALDASEGEVAAAAGAAVCGLSGVVSMGANSTRLLVLGLFVSAGGGVLASARKTRSEANGDSPRIPFADKGPSLANSPFAPPFAPLPGVRGGSFRAVFFGGAKEADASFGSLLITALSFADIVGPRNPKC